MAPNAYHVPEESTPPGYLHLVTVAVLFDALLAMMALENLHGVRISLLTNCGISYPHCRSSPWHGLLRHRCRKQN